MKKKYWICLNAIAQVHQDREVFADSLDEAKAKAIERANDGIWEYEELCDDDIEAVCMRIEDARVEDIYE